MKHHIEEEWGFAHPKQGLKEDEMARTADRQKFGQSLNYTKKNGLEETHHHSIPIDSKG